mgnify:CR=1 FL=1
MVWDQLTDHLDVIWGALLALVIVIALTPAVGGMARLLGVVDRPEPGRRKEMRNIPRLGGLAMFFGVLVPALAFLPLRGEMRSIILGAAVATLVGAIDDFRGLRWWQKLAGQTTAAAIPVAAGVWVHHITFPAAGAHSIPAYIGQPLTAFAIVALMNMMNFLDGMGGRVALKSGIAELSALKAQAKPITVGNVKFYRVRLTDDARGKVVIGETTFLFQYVLLEKR